MFTYPLSPAELLRERAPQMRSWGIPAETIREVGGAIRDMWSDSPGGWVPEWRRKAEEAERAGRWLEAAALYGAAKFPSLSTPSRRDALEQQVRLYLRASRDFPCRFQRHEISVPVGATTTNVAVHELSPLAPAVGRKRPIVCLSGGVDTWKIELHRLALGLATYGDFRVVAIDMPGTGESRVALWPDGHVVYEGVLKALNTEGARTGVVGLSFGGYFAAKLGLMGSVDAAVDIGGPAGLDPHSPASLRGLPNGMLGIISNATWLDAFPTEQEATTMLSAYSLRKDGLFDSARRSPMLVINGDADPYIPRSDTTGFRRFPESTVWLVEGGYHCAAAHLPRILPAMLAWLRCALHGRSARNRVMFWTNRLFLPRLAA